MIKKILLNITERILRSAPHESPEVNGVILQRMSKEFHKWCYGEGYKIFKEKQLDKNL